MLLTSNTQNYQRARPCFGTMLSIRVTGDFDKASLDEAMTKSFKTAWAINCAMSRQNPDSDLSRIRHLRPGETFQLRPQTHNVLKLALRLAEDSQGLFDPVCPNPKRFRRRQNAASWQDICLTSHGVISVRRPLSISLDGIAKGYGADEVCRTMREYTDADICVDAGGDLSVDGQNPILIGVRDAYIPAKTARTIAIDKGGIATSSNYGCDTQLWSRGQETNWPGSITVTAPSCAIADAFTKIAPQNPPPDLLTQYRAEIIASGSRP